MFNVGSGEVLVILLVALIVLGPKRLPEAAKTVGKVMGELRRVSTGFQNEIRSAMDETSSTDPAAGQTARRNVLDKEGASGVKGANGADATDGAVRSVSSQAASGPARTRRPRRTEPLRAAPDPDGPDATGS